MGLISAIVVSRSAKTKGWSGTCAHEFTPPSALRRRPRSIAAQNHNLMPATTWNTLLSSPSAPRRVAVWPKLRSHETPT